MTGSKKRISLTVVGLVAFVALIAGVFVAQHLPEKRATATEQFKGTLLDKPRPINSFSLMGTDDVPFDNQSIQGHWTMIFLDLPIAVRFVRLLWLSWQKCIVYWKKIMCSLCRRWSWCLWIRPEIPCLN